MKIIRSLMLIAVCVLAVTAQTAAPGCALWVNPLIGEIAADGKLTFNMSSKPNN